MYKNTFTLLSLCLLVLIQGCFTMQNPEPKENEAAETYLEYASVPLTKKEVVLSEAFNSNFRGWRVATNATQYRIAIESGHLSMQSKYAGEEMSTINLAHVTGKDNFEIETYFKIDYKSTGGTWNTLLWGANVAASQYNFLKINDTDALFSIGRVDGKHTTENTLSNNNWYGGYSTGNYNKFTIRKIKNEYYYFINETYLFKEPFISFSGTEIGFQVGGLNTLTVEYLLVSKLNI